VCSVVRSDERRVGSAGTRQALITGHWKQCLAVFRRG